MKTLTVKLALTFLLVVLTLSMFGQKYQFAIFVDPQLTWFNSDTKKFSPSSSELGYIVGFAGEKYFAPRYALLFGISLEGAGGNLTYHEAGFKLYTRDQTHDIAANSRITYKGQYLQVPVGFKFKTIEMGYLSIYAHVALKGHFKIKGFAWGDTQGIDREVITNQQVFWAFASYSMGAGVEHSLGGPSAIQTGLHYTNSFTPVYKAGYGTIGFGGLALRIGLVF